jgi:hypothetical protein
MPPGSGPAPGYIIVHSTEAAYAQALAAFFDQLWAAAVPVEGRLKGEPAVGTVPLPAPAGPEKPRPGRGHRDLAPTE